MGWEEVEEEMGDAGGLGHQGKESDAFHLEQLLLLLPPLVPFVDDAAPEDPGVLLQVAEVGGGRGAGDQRGAAVPPRAVHGAHRLGVGLQQPEGGRKSSQGSPHRSTETPRGTEAPPKSPQRGNCPHQATLEGETRPQSTSTWEMLPQSRPKGRGISPQRHEQGDAAPGNLKKRRFPTQATLGKETLPQNHPQEGVPPPFPTKAPQCYSSPPQIPSKEEVISPNPPQKRGFSL